MAPLSLISDAIVTAPLQKADNGPTIDRQFVTGDWPQIGHWRMGFLGRMK